jgi:hypothetical protein
MDSAILEQLNKLSTSQDQLAAGQDKMVACQDKLVANQEQLKGKISAIRAGHWSGLWQFYELRPLQCSGNVQEADGIHPAWHYI